WNLVGSLSQTIPTSLLSSSPPGLVTSAYYTYTGGGYVAEDSIRPGVGYWVKSSGDGSLYMNPSSIEPGAVTTVFTPHASPSYSTITVREPSGNAQTLFVGRDNGEKT